MAATDDFAHYNPDIPDTNCSYDRVCELLKDANKVGEAIEHLPMRHWRCRSLCSAGWPACRGDRTAGKGWHLRCHRNSRPRSLLQVHLPANECFW
jgi:hypothetical protein